MTEQQPMGTASMPSTAQAAPAPDQHAVETDRLKKQLYDFRKTVDPLLYDQVIRYHPHANASNDSFGVFVADYHRLAGEQQG